MEKSVRRKEKERMRHGAKISKAVLWGTLGDKTVIV